MKPSLVQTSIVASVSRRAAVVVRSRNVVERRGATRGALIVRRTPGLPRASERRREVPPSFASSASPGLARRPVRQTVVRRSWATTAIGVRSLGVRFVTVIR